MTTQQIQQLMEFELTWYDRPSLTDRLGLIDEVEADTAEILVPTTVEVIA